MDEGYKIQQGMTSEQRKVRAVVMRTMGSKAYSGGCRAFYTPEEWKAKGERFGTESVLVLVHDGGTLASFCNWDYCETDRVERLQRNLREAGYFIEQCTTWFSAVYKIPEASDVKA